MNGEKFELGSLNYNDYEIWTTTNDNGKTFGRIEIEFKRPVSIVLGANDEVTFHHCKHISSDKDRRNLSFYDKNSQEIVGSLMSIDVDYVPEGGVRHALHLKDYQYKKTLKSYFEDVFGELGLSESEMMDFCVYYDIEFFDSVWDMMDELQSIQCLSSYVMDFIDVDALSEDLHFDKIDDGLWIDVNDFSSFQKVVDEDFGGDISVAVDNWRGVSY